MSDRTALGLAERLQVEAALDAAFEPLRERRTALSPLRVRAAVRWGRGAPSAAPAALRWSGALARLSELSLAAGMSVMVLSATLSPPIGRDSSAADPSRAPAAAEGRVTSAADEEREIRALRLEWYESLRSRLEAFRVDLFVPVQDWLDPTVARPAAVQRLSLPAPRVGTVAARSPY